VPLTVTIWVPIGVAVVVVIVKVELAVVPDGVTEGGTNAQVAPVGRPVVQLKVVVPVNPFKGATETV
jgi:hypothetical protein